MNKTKLPSLVTILILTLITALMWIGFNIYRAFTEKPAPSVSSEISQPLSPSFDQNTVNAIQSSIFFDQSQIPELTLSASPSTAGVPLPPTLQPTPVASPSATPTAIPSPIPTP